MDCDILVIGAGILGLSSAYHMKKRDPLKKIIVVDRFGSPGQGNSGKSEGGFRNVFTSQTNYLLADSTIDFYKHLEKDLGYDLKIHFIGYLWLFSKEQYHSLEGAIKEIRSRGVEIRVYSREELKKLLPILITDLSDNEEAELLGLPEIHYGVYGVKCGSLDPDSLVRCYEQEFLKLGGQVLYNTEVQCLLLRPKEELGIPGEPFVWQDTRIVGADTSKGEIIAETTVVAAGVWSERLLDPIGIDSFMRPKKRQLFAFKNSKLQPLLEVEGFNEVGVIPLTILPKANILFRPELSEGSIWLGCADNLGRMFKLEDDPQPEEDYYTNNIYHALTIYFPCFKDVRPMNMWAGQYAINSLDETPIITSQPGLIYIGAASGSGILKADALGRVVDALQAGDANVELFGKRLFQVSDLGVRNRKVAHETFVM